MSVESRSTSNRLVKSSLAADRSQVCGGCTGLLAGRNYLPVCVIAAAALILALPLLIHGPMPSGHDAAEHVNFTRHFSEQFWRGDFCPRWLLNMNHGLGSPTFFVYPPLTAYVYALLAPVGEAFHFSAFNAMAFLALFGSGVAAYLWTRTVASASVALAAAVLYLLMPYHLAGDFYRRAAFPECWALVWMPLVLYGTTRVINRRRAAAAALAVVYGLLLLSQPGAAMIFSPLPLLLVLALGAPGVRMKSALVVAGSLLLGFGLASFYVISALFHSRYFPVSRLHLALTDNLLPLGRSLFESARFTRVLALTVDGMFFFIAICAAGAFGSARVEQRKQIPLWLAIGVASVLMMSRFSAQLWRRLPWLFDSVQFPWRFNLLLCIAALPLAAIFLSQISWPLGLWRGASLAFMLVLVATWVVSYANVIRDYSDGTAFAHDPVSDADGWFEAWKTPATDSVAALEASAGPKARFISGEGSTQALLWKPRLLEVEASSASGGSLMINQFYYPEWQALLSGEARSLPIEARLPQGLLRVEIPPGNQKVRLDIPVGPAERAGRWVSAFSALACMVLAWHTRS